jgi:carbamoyl-phosphate synthase small subunit
MSNTKGYLLLENGLRFEGQSIGASGTTCGELVFNTGMTGYQDILSDPSYAGQIVTLTYPLIGNYGTHNGNRQSSRVQAAGLIVSEATNPSHWQNEQSISSYLIQENIVALSDIDTRQLTRLIRSQGSLACLMTTDPINESNLATFQAQLDAFRQTASHTSQWVREASTPSLQILQPDGPVQGRISILDLGIKQNILTHLLTRGIEVHLFPANTSADDLLAVKPDAVLLSNGPGDPKMLPEQVSIIQSLLGRVPIYGICLGMQLLSIALGGTTHKLKFGHRGSNHPVMDLRTNKVLITSQNHGYTVQEDSLPPGVTITHRHLLDGTVAGIQEAALSVQAVQFHPEAGPGPEDAATIFDEWLMLLKESACYA